jgi:hypothetical protein
MRQIVPRDLCVSLVELLLQPLSRLGLRCHFASSRVYYRA